MSRRRRLMLVFGGRSAEHEVSVRSAREVRQAIDPGRFDVILVGLTRDGRLRSGPPDAELEAVVDSGDPVASLPALGADVVFPVLHGPGGEDGSFQGYLQTLDVPYVGSGVASSAVCMDKEWTKRLLETHRVPQVPWLALNQCEWGQPRVGTALEDRIEAQIGFPCFAKPANMGSSVGVHRVAAARELDAVLADAFRFDARVVLERGLDARDIEVAVLGNGGPETRASEPGEIVLPEGRWYDYETKYLNEDAGLQIPADLPASVAKRLRQCALDVFRFLECRGLCRVDFLVERTTHEIFLNEPNTLPGFTSASMYPKLMEHVGVPYGDLITTLVDLALDEHGRRASLSHVR